MMWLATDHFSRSGLAALVQLLRRLEAAAYLPCLPRGLAGPEPQEHLFKGGLLHYMLSGWVGLGLPPDMQSNTGTVLRGPQSLSNTGMGRRG